MRTFDPIDFQSHDSSNVVQIYSMTQDAIKGSNRMKDDDRRVKLADQVDGLGAGVAALGDILQWAPKQGALQDTLVGLGGVLRFIGGAISDLNEELFCVGSVSGSGQEDGGGMRLNDGSTLNREDQAMVARVRAILDGAIKVAKESDET